MPGLIGPDEVRAVSEAAFALSGADGVEVLLLHDWTGLTRFADSSIHQSVWREDTAIRIRVVTANRVGIATTNDFSKEGARKAAGSALEMAKVAVPDPMFPGLAPPAPVPGDDRFDQATADTTPRERAELVAALVGQVGPGFHAAGALDTTSMEMAVANTEGQFCYAPVTVAKLTTVVSGGDGGAGTSEQTAGRIADVDAEAVGRTAFRKAEDSQRPRDLAPGRYVVVLEPLAVSTLVSFLSYLAFGGRALQEGRSALTGKVGKRVASEAVTIVDDATSPLTVGTPFDFEGTPKRRVVLLDRGVFVGPVHDRRSARIAGTESTGHALPAPNPDGPIPLNLLLREGPAGVPDMVAATRRGLLVTRFHYSNVVNPIDTTITGMTRDGTWLIEDGRVTHPVKNLRFTQSILEALMQTSMVGRDSEIASEFFFSGSRVPALKVESFNFSGASDH